MDPSRSTITYRISGDLNPARTGQQIVRSYERTGTQLLLTESVSDAGPVSRATWERIEELEALPTYQRDVVGFWQWVSAGQFNSNGVLVQPASRDASVIVYTPSGHMAVLYLPPPGRKTFVDARPTADEARAAMRGTATYFGLYVIQPKSQYVVHYQLGTPNPGATGSSLQRNFEIKGSQLVLTFPPTMLNGQEVRNILTLRRLSGLAEMWPEFRRQLAF